MSRSKDRLYELLPVIDRLRDNEAGEPLRALLQVIAEQVNLVEEDIERLYENWFIETCEDWVVPYIGDLIGYRLVHDAGEPGDESTSQSRARNKILIPRRDVANTIRDRRRKGTLALLELLASDAAGWPARAVEYFKLLDVFQNINQLRLDRGRSVDLHDLDTLDLVDRPFDASAHTVDVRRINSHRTRGRYNIPSVGLFVWRLRSYSITRAPAHCVDRFRNHYTFSILSNDAPLFTRPVAEPAPTHIADELNVPAPIRRLASEERLHDYYGATRSLQIWRDDLNHPISGEQIVIADLSGWAYHPVGDQVAVDPQLGRIAFSPRSVPKSGLWVSYHYGFSADMGGGEYPRRLRAAATETAIYFVCQPGEKKSAPKPTGQDQNQDSTRKYARISEALDQWRQDRSDGKAADAIIEICDSAAYVEQLNIELGPGEHLELRAADGARPCIRLLDWYDNQPDALRVSRLQKEEVSSQVSKGDGQADQSQPSAEEDSAQPCGADQLPHMLFSGLLIAGRGVQITGDIGQVTYRHCTLVPGWSLGCECEPETETEPSIELIQSSARLVIEHSITGAIQVTQDEVNADPSVIRISDSVLDATSSEGEALRAPEYRFAHAELTILRSTVFGEIRTHSIELAENCIFDGPITVARRQRGCMRFCSVRPDMRTPRRYECQPDLIDKAVELKYAAGAERDEAQQRERLRVRPQFNSTRYGTPTYCQLAPACAEEIARGADDESEMGVFHDLFQPQRAANLRARLDEYMPAGMDAGIIYAT
jgi:hypothetical protein